MMDDDDDVLDISRPYRKEDFLFYLEFFFCSFFERIFFLEHFFLSFFHSVCVRVRARFV